jgi:hypothetical protein
VSRRNFTRRFPGYQTTRSTLPGPLSDPENRPKYRQAPSFQRLADEGMKAYIWRMYSTVHRTIPPSVMIHTWSSEFERMSPDYNAYAPADRPRVKQAAQEYRDRLKGTLPSNVLGKVWVFRLSPTARERARCRWEKEVAEGFFHTPWLGSRNRRRCTTRRFVYGPGAKPVGGEPRSMRRPRRRAFLEEKRLRLRNTGARGIPVRSKGQVASGCLVHS